MHTKEMRLHCLNPRELSEGMDVERVNSELQGSDLFQTKKPPERPLPVLPS